MHAQPSRSAAFPLTRADPPSRLRAISEPPRRSSETDPQTRRCPCRRIRVGFVGPHPTVGDNMSEPNDSHPNSRGERDGERAEFGGLPIRDALTFDDVLLVPAASQVLPRDVEHPHAAHARDPPQRPVRLGRDGHRHGARDGDLHGPERGPRRGPSEPAARRAGRGSRQGEALRGGPDRRPGDDAARPEHSRGAPHHGAAPDLGRSGHAGRQGGRHPDEPRPALRAQRRPADLEHDDAAREADHASRRAPASTAARSCCTSTASRSCSSWTSRAICAG